MFWPQAQAPTLARFTLRFELRNTGRLLPRTCAALLYLCCALIVIDAGQGQETRTVKASKVVYREWTDATDKKLGECAIEGFIVRTFKSERILSAVRLKPRQRRSFDINLADLSQVDQAAAAEQWQTQQKALSSEAFLKLFRQKRKSVEKDLAKKEKERRELDTARLRAAENLLTKAESTPIATGTNMMCGSVTNVTLAREGVTEADAAGTEPSSTSEQGLAHDGVISSVVINREGTLLASAAATHFGDQRPTRDRYAIKVWSTIENKLLHEIDGHQFPIRSLALSHDGQRLVSNSIDGEIRLWSFPDGRLLATLKASSTSADDAEVNIIPQAIAIAADDAILVAAHPEGFDRWQVTDGRLLDQYRFDSTPNAAVEQFFPSSMVVSGDGEQALVSGSYTDNAGTGYDAITLWQLPQGTMVRKFTNVSSTCLDATSDWQTLVVGAPSGIYIYNIADGQFLWRIKPDETGHVRAIRITADGTRIISANQFGQIMVWSLKDGRLLKTLYNRNVGITSVAVTPDSGTAIVADWVGAIKIVCLQKYLFVRYVVDPLVKVDTTKFVLLYRERETKEPKFVTELEQIPETATEVHWQWKQVATDAIEYHARTGSSSSSSGYTYTYTIIHTYSYR